MFCLVSGSDSNGEHEPLAPQDFINVSMRRKVIGKLIFPTLSSDNFVFKSYKIMSRAQNAQSIINGAFLFEFNSKKDKIISAKICFGGISTDFIHAEKLEKFLVDKNLFTNDNLQGAIQVLKDELKPEEIGDMPTPEDRRRIAISLFYKFVLNISPSEKIEKKYKSGGNLLIREMSSGKQVIDVNEGKSKLFKRIPKIEGDIQCTGEAQYVNDIPKHLNELHAAFVLGDKVHGRIVKIDAEEALKLPGVFAFSTVPKTYRDLTTLCLSNSVFTHLKLKKFSALINCCTMDNQLE